MQELESILNMWQQSWQNPAMRHVMLVHFPVVLAFLLVPLALLTSVWAGTFRKTLIIFCFITTSFVLVTFDFVDGAILVAGVTFC